MKVVQQELEERKQKLADLEALGQYPNRQAAHKTRIAELEKALKGIKKSDDAEFFEKAKQGLSGHGVEFA